MRRKDKYRESGREKRRRQDWKDIMHAGRGTGGGHARHGGGGRYEVGGTSTDAEAATTTTTTTTMKPVDQAPIVIRLSLADC